MFDGRTNRRPLALWIFLLVAASAAWAETLTYELTPQPWAGTLQVELVWQTGRRSASSLCISQQWGTVSDGPSLIRSMRTEQGVEVGRSGGCWSFRHRSSAALRVRYTVEPPQATFTWDRSHHPICTDTFFHGIGSTFLLVPKPGYGGAPETYEVLLRWRLPRGWQAVCSWGIGAHVGAPMDVSDLRHAVYLAGPLVKQHVDVPEADRLTVALIDAFDFDAADLARMAADIISDQVRFMHEPAFPEFVVTAIPVGPALGGAGQKMAGTGLHHSLALFLSPEGRITSGLEHLFAHELFHFWNGRTLRAAEPEAMVYWFVEGFTDYYALRLLHDAGRWSDATYADWINRHVRAYYTNPARNATNARIQAAHRSESDTVGELPYQRGLLLAVRWHKLARDRGVSEGVDRLLRALVARGRRGTRLDNGLIRRIGRARLGAWFEEEFERYVVRAATIELAPDVLEPALSGAYADVYPYELGFDQRRSQNAKRVLGLVPGSAAEQAGLREGDELTGWRIFYRDVNQRVRIHIKRDGQEQTIRYYPRGDKQEVLQFAPREADR